MSLRFDADGEYVDHGSGSSIDNISAGSFRLWVNLANVTTSDVYIYTKAGGAGVFTTFQASIQSANFSKAIGRGAFGDRLDVTSSGGVLAAGWNYVCGRWDLAGANGDQQLAVGSLTTRAVEPAYSTQQVGTGAHDNSSNNLFVGRLVPGDHFGDYAVAVLELFNTNHSLALLIAQQYRWFAPLSGCVLRTAYGVHGAGTQADWSGNLNNGAVTGATVDSHVPLGPPFGFDRGWMGAFAAIGPEASARWPNKHNLRPRAFGPGLAR